MKQSPQTKNPSCRHSAAACVAGRSLACERIPLRYRSNFQRKKQHRHSGIFRVADLGPGTMPRGKYPESPAPAGSHALISRTPPPGGMLHANLGLPRPPPRNFQPPLPQQALKTNSNSAPIKPMSFPSSGRVKQSPQTKNPSCRHSVAACVSDHSRGQALAPANPLSPNGNTPPIVIPESPPPGGHASPLERMRSAASQDTARRTRMFWRGGAGGGGRQRRRIFSDNFA